MTRRRPGAAALVLLTLVFLPGCARAPSESVLEPVHRLLALTEPPAPALVPRACSADDEIRPALGCIPYLLLSSEAGVRPEAPVVHRRFTLPAAFVGHDFVVEPLYRPGEREGLHDLPRTVVHDAPAELDVAFRLPPDTVGRTVDLNVRIRPIPPALQTTETRPIPIGPGAVLTLGTAIDPLGIHTLAAPVEFRLGARTAAGEQELLRTVLDPADPAARAWIDHRIDLGAFAGHSVRFIFETRLRPRAGQADAEAFGFPLWGAPDVLEPRPRGARPNVILISLDTLRADHVGAYGCELPTTPVLDRLAADGALFEHAVATYPATPASHMTMFTGLYPTVHRVLGPLTPLPPEVPTLPEMLAGHGYQTAAVTEDAMLAATSGFARGISYYRENKGSSMWDSSGQVDVTFAAGLRWLEAHRGERFFLFLHTYQVHGPYSPPPAFDLFRTYRADGREVPITDDAPLGVRDRHLYAGEVRYTDSELGTLLERLAALGERDRTLVIVTSDHGEEFWEHGWKGHDESLYDEVLRVPLVMHAPGLVPAGVRIPTQVSLVDLAPTVLDLLGLPAPATMQGVSVVPLLRDPTAPAFANRVVFAELAKKREPFLVGARTDTLKWIFRVDGTRPPQVYDLRADPRERANIADPDLIAQGEALITQYREGARAAMARLRGGTEAPQVPTPTTLDARTVEKLRALGYVQ